VSQGHAPKKKLFMGGRISAVGQCVALCVRGPEFDSQV